MVVQSINSAIEIAGSQKKLAEACGVKQPTVWAWLHGKKKVSAQNAARIEKVTSGEVKAHDIRPDLPELFPHPDNAV